MFKLMFNNILGFRYNIYGHGCTSNGIELNVIFDIPNDPLWHKITCYILANKLHCPINKYSYGIDWNHLLIPLGFKERHDVHSRKYFPTFYSIESLNRFILLVNTNFLIDVK